MSRDPLCTNGHGDALTADCSMCDLIAMVRASERALVLNALGVPVTQTPYTGSDPYEP